ncbi:plasmid mobilization relaxosome protein MobC [Carboxylicivirga mesophila]|uniref:Plasmid mobilization relaxosome protein MobC n=1 Tax=Carboxylicivirga mesophila TaxID=1166478 RepID=A0ABS5K4I8_9BACT|nr:plasmid mobilization relaxosome protein MobC [Carboxylicivirga mesophila]MBS2209936.1 plasmid mobilization relaxosome protein MobC [Carboxylicivirga mesophila]
MRPRIGEKDKLSEHIILRLTKSEKAEILNRVKEEKLLSVADYVRSRLFKKRLSKRITVSEEYVRTFRTMDYNLTKIGINLNQIAHKLNSYNTYILTEEDKDAFRDCHGQLNECFSILGKFLLKIR